MVDSQTHYSLAAGKPTHAQGRVIIEMAPAFAPNHVANVKALSREGYFVNGAVTRVQDAGGRFTPLPDPDTYATEVGFIDGMPVCRHRQQPALAQG